MAATSRHVRVVEGAPQGVCRQCLCPQGEPQPPLPIRETLQDQQVGLALDPIKLLLLPWVLV